MTIKTFYCIFYSSIKHSILHNCSGSLNERYKCQVPRYAWQTGRSTTVAVVCVTETGRYISGEVRIRLLLRVSVAMQTLQLCFITENKIRRNAGIYLCKKMRLDSPYFFLLIQCVYKAKFNLRLFYKFTSTYTITLHHDLEFYPKKWFNKKKTLLNHNTVHITIFIVYSLRILTKYDKASFHAILVLNG